MAASTYMTLEEMLREVPPGAPSQAQIIMSFRQSVLLDALRIRNIGNAGADYTVTTELPTVQRRGLNEDFAQSSRGNVEPGHEGLRIYGVRLQDDRAARRMGLSDPAAQNRGAARATRLTLESDLITGDPDTNPKTMAGFQFWAENSGQTASTSISAGSTAGGAALSVKALRDAIDECMDPSFMVMSQYMRNRLTGGAEDTGVAGYIEWQDGPFGRRIASFDGLPIVTVQKDVSNARLLPFSEAAASGGSTATSIYIVSQGPEGWYMFQNGMPQVDEMAVTASQVPRELMWLCASVATNPFSVIRLKHIGDLAVVA